MDPTTLFSDQPPVRNRLSTRIIASSAVALLVVLSMIGWTLWLSWQLEGAGAAINDAGSLRMQASRVAVELVREPVTDAQTRADAVLAFVHAQDRVFSELERGDPARPLLLPAEQPVQAQMTRVVDIWQQQLRPAALMALDGGTPNAYLDLLPVFVAQADVLVRMIESVSSRKTSMLRISQSILVVIACIGTLALIYLLYLWIIFPVLQLRDGLRRMTSRDFSVRLPVESQDEFGALAMGFNTMADELEGLYSELEGRVEEKTAELASRNAVLATLYDIAAFLNQPNNIESVCQGFLDRVMRQFDAGGGSVRTLNPTGDNLSLVLSQGLSARHGDEEFCMKATDCFCGKATRKGPVIISDTEKMQEIPARFLCAKEGFRSLAVFPIQAQDEVLGSYSLHFNQPRVMGAEEHHLLETLGRHLGIALQNRRLGVQARQLAMEQERTLMAQGLHDSIAQGLNFLNLELQVLEQAVVREDMGEVRDIVPLLRTGVTESYQDVRELLNNFRTRLGEGGDLLGAVEETVARFRRQTGIDVALEVGDLSGGAALSREQQLQVLFILQEALSNVRKHAQSSKVDVRMSNGQDFRLLVADNGIGFDPDVVDGLEGHLGRKIMQERAKRMRAELNIDTAPGQGVAVSLVLPASARQAA
ncbi:type IV pili methyl-accepting chemotaxis transducer N-terminal domain-containing protein [Allopusillimonas ginsengisoli]|uniref:type IV pili methyl-accepting chemotaxis transducer N-terminal domain-containing protein n=1 Tax=Allopusillimonas ginsengisoli TaxID=453575 RepID=UPI0010C1DF24|nr:HAMP domain-containing protein [Allopusillimonas ginsengisoli]